MSLNTGSTYTIKNYGSGKMLNIYNSGGVGSGTNVVQWSADGSTEQKWLLQSGSSSGTYNLCSRFDTDLVLDAYSPMRPIPSGANADIWKDNDPQAQNLRITEVGSGRYTIALSSKSSLLLTARGSANGSAGGTSASSDGNVFWSTYSAGNSRQQWIIEEVGNTDRHSPPVAGLYNLVSANGANLNVYAGHDANGTSLVMWEDDGTVDQQFLLSNQNGRSVLFARCSSNGNNRVVDAYRPGSTIQNGTKAQIWENNDPAAQEMVVTPLSGGYYKISLRSNSQLALSASGAGNNSAVTFSNYTGANGQKWKFEKVDPNANGAMDTHNPPSTGMYNIVCSNGAYLNVYAGRDANLTAMVMWSPDGSVDQQFRLGSYGNGSKLYAMCSSGGNNRVLDAYRPSGGVANGAKAQLYDSNDDISQTLIITPKGNGLFKIALNSNKSLALTAAGSANNSGVTYTYYTGAANQLWKFNKITPIDISTHQPPSEGVYNLVNSNGAYLNIYAGTDANGTKAVLWAADGSADQKFRLTNRSDSSRLYAMCSFGGSGRVLDAYKPGQYVLNGTSVQIWDPTDDAAQLLCISRVGAKYKVALQSNTSLALTASGSANNSAVTYSTYTGAANQLWTLNRLGDWSEESVPDSFSIEYNYTENCYPDRNGFQPLAWVCHIAEGTTNGTIAWFKNPDSQVSSNYVIGRDGRIVEMVPVDKAPWTNGTSTDPSNNNWWGNATADIVLKNKSNANYYTLTIEFEGFYNVTGGALTQAQIKAAAWLMKYVRRVYNVTIPFDREHILGHYQINPITKPHCPGEAFQFDELIEELGGEEGGWDNPNYNPSTGGPQISVFNLYFLKNGGKYLTMNPNGTNTETVVVDPDFVGNTAVMENEKLPYDHSRNKHNIRQLFRLFPNGFIKPACSDRGITKYTLGRQNTELTLMENGRLSSVQDYNLSYLFDDATESFKIVRVISAGLEYRLQVTASGIKFTGAVSADSALSSAQQWEFEALSTNDDDGLSYYDEFESDYSKYAVTENSSPAFNYIKVTGMPALQLFYPDGYERFHPYSGMRNLSFNSLENRIYDPNGPEPTNDYDAYSKYRTVSDIVKGFYRRVFKNATGSDHPTPTDLNCLYNLFGAFMEAPRVNKFHMGVDLNTDILISTADELAMDIRKGADVYTAHSGIIAINGGDYGTFAIYDPDNEVTYLYLHLRDIPTTPEMAVGEEISADTKIGIESNKSLEGIGKHLHFEVRNGDIRECKIYNNSTGNEPVAAVNSMTFPMKDSLSPYRYML